jgi:hypothetical protein
MKTLIVCLLVLSLQLRAAEPEKPRHRLLMASLAVFAIGNALDTASSFGPGRETNPILAQNGRFTAASAGIKWGIAGGVLAVEMLVVRKHPAAAQPFVYSNFAMGATFGAIAVRNFRLDR